MVGKNEFLVGDAHGARSDAEHSLLVSQDPMSWSEVKRRLGHFSDGLRRDLVAAGLVLGPSQLWWPRALAITPLLMLLAFALVRLNVGMESQRDLGYLPFLPFVTLALAQRLWRLQDGRTHVGIALVKQKQDEMLLLKRAPTPPEMGLAVALFGPAVLVGSGLDGFQSLLSERSGGGCGGGCGGCGD